MPILTCIRFGSDINRFQYSVHLIVEETQLELTVLKFYGKKDQCSNECDVKNVKCGFK